MNNACRLLFCLSMLLLLPLSQRAGGAEGDQPQVGQTPHDLDVQVTVNVDHLLFLPESYGQESEKKWPVILFLHGAGERGSDLEKVKIHGPPKIVENKKDFPFIVISPQCAEEESWSADALIALLDAVTAKLNVDRDRIYLTGLSMGGYGTWRTAIRYPDRFAAIAPICGGGNAAKVGAIKHLPTWVFHGDKDSAVPVQRSIEMVDALKAAGGNVKFTRYPEAEHDSWTETYNNPELYKWFLSHKRGE